MGLLGNDEFFAKLAELFESRRGKDHGSIYLSQKRLSYGEELPQAGDESSLADLHPPRPLPVIIRATNGKGGDKKKDKIKLSTVVDAEALPAFYDRYADVCKAGMMLLKPRDRKDRKKKKKTKRKAGTGAAATATAAAAGA